MISCTGILFRPSISLDNLLIIRSGSFPEFVKVFKIFTPNFFGTAIVILNRNATRSTLDSFFPLFFDGCLQCRLAYSFGYCSQVGDGLEQTFVICAKELLISCHKISDESSAIASKNYIV